MSHSLVIGSTYRDTFLSEDGVLIRNVIAVRVTPRSGTDYSVHALMRLRDVDVRLSDGFRPDLAIDVAVRDVGAWRKGRHDLHLRDFDDSLGDQS